MHNITVDIISFTSILLIIAAATTCISRFTKLPYTILLVVIGFILAYVAKVGPHFLSPFADYKINPDIILYACLPTLIFESAYSMDARLFKHNLVPVLTLAIPGLFISTTIIGVFVWWLTPLDFLPALLLGCILSATDPVAVIALFKQLGVPKRLTVLVEGESLLNDSTAIVTAKTILFVILAGAVTADTVTHGVFEFFKEFFGGIGVGVLVTMLIGYGLPFLKDEPVAELSLTVILAYLAFIIADEVFHVSGVMAVITAGLMMAGWGRTKISSKASDYLHHLLELLAYVANSLIFLLVGLSVKPGSLLQNIEILAVVIVVMLISRAMIIYGLIPFIGKLPNAEPIDARYQTIMWWGGLRGAIALAIVFGFKDIPNQDILASVVMGVVLFTILVQGLSINKLISWLKLDEPPLSDKVAKAEAELAAEKTTRERIERLQKGGLFSLKVAELLRDKTDKAIEESRDRLNTLREKELNKEEERRLLFLTCFAAEKHLYYDMFRKGHLSETAYRSLNIDVDIEIDQMRYHSSLTRSGYVMIGKHFYVTLINFIDKIPGLHSLVNNLKITLAINNYEKRWGLHQGSTAVLEHLDELADLESIEVSVVQEVREKFEEWDKCTKDYLDTLTDQYPEFVSDMQRRLGERILLHAKSEAVRQQAQQGLLPDGVAEEMMKDYLDEIYKLRHHRAQHLIVDPHELLKRIPFLAEVPDAEVENIIKLLKEHRANAGEDIIKEGAVEDELYLIMRGVVRVVKDIDGKAVDLATLMAGDFFGEIALLFGVKRTATCKAVTPCILYSLDRKDFEKVKSKFPAISRALEVEAEKRKHEING